MSDSGRSPRPAHIPGLMASIDDLRLYYAVIYHEILPSLKEMVQSMNTSLQTRFDQWTIKRSHCRIPEYLILETSFYKRGRYEVLEGLHTPLGSIPLGLGGEGSNDHKLSRKFLDDFDWEITDVTDRVLHYWYYQDDDTAWGPFEFEEVPWYDADPTTRLYIVQRIRQTSFVSDQSTVEPIVFSRIVLKYPEQYDENDRIFEELSRSTS
ncbi:hypothetical protein LTR84_002008 [Exophiala bonariae]|uniref:Uncharacterized protein n=1 Tax=Exophiala bonariae TaxID=1690606 RepID=A0AAV9MRG0_9EURO|nr:hypothetical protein LTR84_002008 [Exophiala bonariae]